jgi:hypothetical protein
VKQALDSMWIFLQMPCIIAWALITGRLTVKWDRDKVHFPTELMYPFAMLAFRYKWAVPVYGWIVRKCIKEATA